jgi:PleD family two-component response regulator
LLRCFWYHYGKFIKENILAISNSNVFLFQGQRMQLVDGVQQLLPAIEQRVVVAHDAETASTQLNKSAPDFSIVGYATLKQYEETAAQIRATLNGENKEWKVIFEPGMA